MHLEMKTQCEKCGSALPPDGEAYICSYECTLCPPCAANVHGVCPNCGGELSNRPRRKTAIENAQNGSLQAARHARPWLIWVVSVGLWTLVGVAAGLSMYQLDRSMGKSAPLGEELVRPLVNYLIFGFLTPFLWGFAIRHPIQRDNWACRSLQYAFGAVAFCVVHVILRGLVYPVWDPRVNGFAYAAWNPHTGVFNFQWLLFKRLFLYDIVDDTVSIYLPILLVAHALWYYRSFKDRELRASQLEGQLAKAHLQALKNQLQPHFLFNTLHSISALMLTDVRAADRMMSRLSDLLRISLESEGIQIIPLTQELEFVNGYLEIEKVRFEDRLNVVFDVAPDTLDALVPHLLLQPLVENAVRHGISRRSSNGEIRIAASHNDGSLCLKVRDNGPGIEKSISSQTQTKTGLGLRATKERLQTLYANEQSMEIRSAPESGVEVEVRIPFRTEPRQLVYEVAQADFGVA
jgi:two-component system, LytTR family, sensor kinase